jgi:hypothetical protein
MATITKTAATKSSAVEYAGLSMTTSIFCRSDRSEPKEVSRLRGISAVAFATFLESLVGRRAHLALRPVVTITKTLH